MRTKAKKSSAKKSSATKKRAEHDGKPIAGDDGQTILGTLELGRDLLVVRTNTFKGRTSLDIRRFWDAGEEWAPSPKGVSIPGDSAEELLDMLDANRAALIKAFRRTED